MKQKLDLDAWARKDHFQFFRTFEEPFFGLTVELDATRAREAARDKKQSFFLTYLHASLQAANETEPFRYRIHGSEVWIYDAVHASPTINRPDGTFGFAYMDYKPGFEAFAGAAEREIARVRSTTGLVPALSGENVIHYSSLPWIRFTQLSHARALSRPDSCPKIAFGKLTESAGRQLLPASIHVHHALMDGYHVGEFLERFQEKLSS